MFNTWVIKDTKRSPRQKRKMLEPEIIFDFRHVESPLPYFEILPAQLLSDRRYQSLSRQEQGDFLRLIMLMWLEKCRYVKHAELLAVSLGMTPQEWLALESRLLDAGLLVVSPDGLYLVQPELRTQFLHNRQANANRKRFKSSSPSADAGSFADTNESAT